MTDKEPNRPRPMFHRLFGNSRTFTLCSIAYVLGGYTLIQEYWPDSDMAFYILVAVGAVGGYLILKRRRERG